MILRATHTHLYPGHRGTISGLAQLADLAAGGDCLVEFSDGSVAAAKISKSANDWRLDTRAYRTAAGTDIAEKHWSVRLQDAGGEIEFRILKQSREK
ncbi:MAG: hypothetical protein PVI79_08995 [Gammaproteobacteria bacterium]|jgi:hypothetical protein